MKRVRSNSIDTHNAPKRKRSNTQTWGGFFQSVFDTFLNLFRNEETTVVEDDNTVMAEQDDFIENEFVADEDIEDLSGQTPLHKAVIDGNLDEVIELVASGAELDIYDNYGMLPLDYANNDNIRDFLLENGAHEPGSPTPLHSLVLNNDVAAIHQLLDQNSSDLNALDTQGATPLHYAVQMGHLDSVIVLVGRGAKLAQVDKAGFPPIFYANDAIKQFLLGCGAPDFDPETRIDLAHNALHAAVLAGDYQECERILTEDPSMINDFNRSSESPLILAVDNQNDAIADLLLTHDADIEIRDINGNTPLLRAVATGNQSITDRLLARGADPDVSNDDQIGIVELAKTTNKHSPFSKHLKHMVGLSDIEVSRIQDAFEALLQNELLNADAQHKMPLLILGELHGKFKIYQIEKAMLQVAKKYGFETLYTEKPNEEFSVMPIEHKAKDTLNMSIIPVDTHPNRLAASVAERNVYIAAGISQANKPGVLITGSDHLKGLLKDAKSKIDTDKYYLIPINLGKLSNVKGEPSPENSFAQNPSNVVQIQKDHGCFTSINIVNAQWNKSAILNDYRRPQNKTTQRQVAEPRKRRSLGV